MSEVASPLWASIVGQNAPSVAETTAPAAPHSRQAQPKTSRMVAAPKSEFIARACPSMRSWSLPSS